MVDKDDVRDAVEGTLDHVDYPLTTQMGLVGGDISMSTTFEVGDESISAMEIATVVDFDFPYEDEDALMEDLVNGIYDHFK